MLDWKNKDTIAALKELTNIVSKKSKPIGFWLGAGISKWCEYPLWQDLADEFHKIFSKYEPTYDLETALSLLNHNLPRFFGYCRSINPQRYFSTLSELLPTKKPSLVYLRLLRILQEFSPLRILTTNVDELLERNLTNPTLIQRENLEQVQRLSAEQGSFIAKVHGSTSAVNSMVFTEEDYNSVVNDEKFQSSLCGFISSHSVIFLGYSLRDEYLLKLLEKNISLKNIFGDGPHFAILSQYRENLPKSIRQIIYTSKLQSDHRSAIRVLESAKAFVKASDSIRKNSLETQSTKMESKHFITDISPPGTWQNSQDFKLADVEGNEVSVGFVGTGINNSELVTNVSTAMHDIVVGLMCFDQILFPLHSANRVYGTLGGDILGRLVDEGIIKFIHSTSEESVLFKNEDRLSQGSLVSINNMRLQTADASIRAQFRAPLGKESDTENYFEKLRLNTFTVSSIEIDKNTIPSEVENLQLPNDAILLPDIPNIVRSLVAYPDVRESLGISEGTPINLVSPWLIFPTLRLSQVIRVGAICNALRIPSVKLNFGLSSLAGPIFPATSSEYWVDKIAGYVIAGDLEVNVGDLFLHDKSLLSVVLSFRETAEGIDLRRSILEQLQTNESGELIPSLNGNLRSILSPSVLGKSKNKFGSLLISEKISGVQASNLALWNDPNSDAETTKRWKRRSSSEFHGYCQKFGISAYDPCPCGSGDKKKFCCGLTFLEA